ncbi:MAG: hypothetical protein ACP5IJ_02305, partial [Candidatus Nanoarchaeia archaeon]
MAFLKHTTKKLVKKISAKKASATAVLLIFLALAGTIFVGKYFTGKASAGANVASTNSRIPINDCMNITSSGYYVLNQSIIDSSAGICINISASNVIFDGDGHTINGIYSEDEGYTNGIYVYNPSTTLTNVTIKNVIVTDWGDGIY